MGPVRGTNWCSDYYQAALPGSTTVECDNDRSTNPHPTPGNTHFQMYETRNLQLCRNCNCVILSAQLHRYPCCAVSLVLGLPLDMPSQLCSWPPAVLRVQHIQPEVDGTRHTLHMHADTQVGEVNSSVDADCEKGVACLPKQTAGHNCLCMGGKRKLTHPPADMLETHATTGGTGPGRSSTSLHPCPSCFKQPSHFHHKPP